MEYIFSRKNVDPRNEYYWGNISEDDKNKLRAINKKRDELDQEERLVFCPDGIVGRISGSVFPQPPMYFSHEKTP